MHLKIHLEGISASHHALDGSFHQTLQRRRDSAGGHARSAGQCFCLHAPFIGAHTKPVGADLLDKIDIGTLATEDRMKPERAAETIHRLSEMAAATGSQWALGNVACARALVSEGASAEAFYREAIERLGRTRIRVQFARARLLYGEWLRRENRRVDARTELRAVRAASSRRERPGARENTATSKVTPSEASSALMSRPPLPLRDQTTWPRVISTWARCSRA